MFPVLLYQQYVDSTCLHFSDIFRGIEYGMHLHQKQDIILEH